MRISLGASAANTFGLATSPARRTVVNTERRGNRVMINSNRFMRSTLRVSRRRGDQRWRGFLPAGRQARGGPRALAAFVKRPQAARSNRRYIYSLESHIQAVNQKRIGRATREYRISFHRLPAVHRRD